jgi:hypothetical protein
MYATFVSDEIAIALECNRYWFFWGGGVNECVLWLDKKNRSLSLAWSHFYDFVNVSPEKIAASLTQYRQQMYRTITVTVEGK